MATTRNTRRSREDNDDRDDRRGSSRRNGGDRNGKKTFTNKIVLPKHRMAYEHVWKAWKGDLTDGTPKFQYIAMITDKGIIDKLEAMVDKAIEEGRKRYPKHNWDSKKVNLPDFQRGRDKFPKDPDFKNCWCVSPKSLTAPGIVDLDRNEIDDPTEVYSGAWVKAQISIYPFGKGSYFGVAVGLDHIQKVKDGEPMAANAGNPEDVEWGDEDWDDDDDDQDDDDRRSSRSRGKRSRDDDEDDDEDDRPKHGRGRSSHDDDDEDDDDRSKRRSRRRNSDDDYED